MSRRPTWTVVTPSSKEQARISLTDPLRIFTSPLFDPTRPNPLTPAELNSVSVNVPPTTEAAVLAPAEVALALIPSTEESKNNALIQQVEANRSAVRGLVAHPLIGEAIQFEALANTQPLEGTPTGGYEEIKNLIPQLAQLVDNTPTPLFMDLPEKLEPNEAKHLIDQYAQARASLVYSIAQGGNGMTTQEARAKLAAIDTLFGTIAKYYTVPETTGPIRLGKIAIEFIGDLQLLANPQQANQHTEEIWSHLSKSLILLQNQVQADSTLHQLGSVIEAKNNQGLREQLPAIAGEIAANFGAEIQREMTQGNSLANVSLPAEQISPPLRQILQQDDESFLGYEYTLAKLFYQSGMLGEDTARLLVESGQTAGVKIFESPQNFITAIKGLGNFDLLNILEELRQNFAPGKQEQVSRFIIAGQTLKGLVALRRQHILAQPMNIPAVQEKLQPELDALQKLSDFARFIEGLPEAHFITPPTTVIRNTHGLDTHLETGASPNWFELIANIFPHASGKTADGRPIISSLAMTTVIKTADSGQSIPVPQTLLGLRKLLPLTLTQLMREALANAKTAHNISLGSETFVEYALAVAKIFGIDTDLVQAEGARLTEAVATIPPENQTFTEAVKQALEIARKYNLLEPFKGHPYPVYAAAITGLLAPLAQIMVIAPDGIQQSIAHLLTLSRGAEFRPGSVDLAYVQRVATYLSSLQVVQGNNQRKSEVHADQPKVTVEQLATRLQYQFPHQMDELRRLASHAIQCIDNQPAGINDYFLDTVQETRGRQQAKKHNVAIFGESGAGKNWMIRRIFDTLQELGANIFVFQTSWASITPSGYKGSSIDEVINRAVDALHQREKHLNPNHTAADTVRAISAGKLVLNLTEFNIGSDKAAVDSQKSFREEAIRGLFALLGNQDYLVEVNHPEAPGQKMLVNTRYVSCWVDAADTKGQDGLKAEDRFARGVIANLLPKTHISSDDLIKLWDSVDLAGRMSGEAVTFKPITIQMLAPLWQSPADKNPYAPKLAIDTDIKKHLEKYPITRGIPITWTSRSEATFLYYVSQILRESHTGIRALTERAHSTLTGFVAMLGQDELAHYIKSDSQQNPLFMVTPELVEAAFKKKQA